MNAGQQPIDSRIVPIVIALSTSVLVAVIWPFLPHPLVVLIFGFIPFAAWLALKFPFHVVLGFVVFSFFRIHEVIPVLSPLHFPQLLALGTIFVIAWHGFISREIKPYWSRELALLSTFFALVTIGVVFASNRGIALGEWSGVYVKIYVMSLACSWLLQREGDFVLITRTFCLAGTLVGGTAVYNKQMAIGLVEETRVTIGREMGSILGDPNDLALVLLFPAAFALSMALEKRLPHWERLFGLIGFAVLLLAVVATQSRGGLLGIVAVMGMAAWHRVRSNMLLVFGGGAAMMVLFVVAGISDRASGGAIDEGIDESAMGRIYAWGAAWGMGLDNPLFGVGLKNFFYNYYFYSAHWDGLNHAVHSTWFGVLAETGFVGVSVFITMVVLTLRTATHVVTLYDLSALHPAVAVTALAMPGSVVGFMVSGTFLAQGFTWPIYLQLAIVVAVARYAKRCAR